MEAGGEAALLRMKIFCRKTNNNGEVARNTVAVCKVALLRMKNFCRHRSANIRNEEGSIGLAKERHLTMFGEWG